MQKKTVMANMTNIIFIEVQNICGNLKVKLGETKGRDAMMWFRQTSSRHVTFVGSINCGARSSHVIFQTLLQDIKVQHENVAEYDYNHLDILVTAMKSVALRYGLSYVDQSYDNLVCSSTRV